MASPEKALIDYLYLNPAFARRKIWEFADQPGGFRSTGQRVFDQEVRVSCRVFIARTGQSVSGMYAKEGIKPCLILRISSHFFRRRFAFQAEYLREYLQYKILEIIFDSLRQRSFLYGRHGDSDRPREHRFSEDLDFDNLSLKSEDFEKLTDEIVRGLKLIGLKARPRQA